jgi:hypothetical protein
MSKTTIDMAREAGWPIEAGNELPDTGGMCFKTFEALVRADEREACAKVCDDYFGFNAIAGAIRSKGNT